MFECQTETQFKTQPGPVSKKATPRPHDPGSPDQRSILTFTSSKPNIFSICSYIKKGFKKLSRNTCEWNVLKIKILLRKPFDLNKAN